MTGKTTSKSSNGRVRNTAVLKRGAPTPNTSAFKTPARPPAKLESMTARAKKELVARLIRRPEPAPTPTVAQAIKALEAPVRRFHGTKVPLSWFPRELVDPNHAGTFGYMFSASVRNATKLPFNVATQALLTQLGNLMGDAGRGPGQVLFYWLTDGTTHRHRRATMTELFDQVQEAVIPLDVVEPAALAMHLVRQPARRHQHHLEVFGKAVDRLAQPLAQPVTATRGGNRELQDADL